MTQSLVSRLASLLGIYNMLLFFSLDAASLIRTTTPSPEVLKLIRSLLLATIGASISVFVSLTVSLLANVCDEHGINGDFC